MTTSILQLLKDLETKHHIEILYACESGSRAWGFASPDSDYDIRFIYRRPFTETLSIGDPPSSIECPIENDLDPAGWDLRKTLGLLRKNNGALIEWLHSPVCYRADESFVQQIRTLAQENINPRDLANHYRGLANQIYRSRIKDQAPSAKAYLYALRAQLAAGFILDRHSLPPVPFAELIPTAPEQVEKAIHELVAWKATATENASPGNIDVLDSFLATSIPELSERIAQVVPQTTPIAPYDELLRAWSQIPSLSQPKLRKSDFTLARVRESDLLLFECVSGSRSFGTDHARSDYDLRGVFAAPPSFLCGLESIDQISDAKSDEVYYELGRFISLLESNNPNLIELLFTPKNCIRHQDPVFELITADIFLSKLCQQTFGNYAMGQIRKARGLNKKIVNPEPEQRRHLREFCYVLEGQGSVALVDWLERHSVNESECGLVAVNHAPNTYAIFHDAHKSYRGIFSSKDDWALVCSSVPQEAQPIAWMQCNLDAFKAHCRSHREYWQWVSERNEDRYATNAGHGRGYDSKNLMHTLRLLDQATEIAKEGKITLPRPDAEWLKKVKQGEYTYEDILKIADDKNAEMEAAYQTCNLPERPNRHQVNDLLLEMRNRLHQRR
ncbi:nucleotidyltransferase domain-containing protein [Verrucomicrobiaceae bacterium R5-34]|nr:nucleotidyltransferase domain-containing protein [Verrucomicrobiaceae bacterium R5-34]